MNTNREEYLHYFEARFSEWVRSALLEPRRGELPGEVRRELAAEPFYGDVRAKLGDELLNWLGWGLKQELIEEEGHRFRAISGRAGPFKWFSQRDWKRYPLHPNWEAYVHLAYFARLWQPCRDRGLSLDFEKKAVDEKGALDLVVRRGPHTIWYVEVKHRPEGPRGARELCKRVAEHGHKGVDMNMEPKGKDPLQKARYVTREQPEFFSVVALDFARHFRVAHGKGNHFQLQEVSDPLVRPLDWPP